MVVPGTRNETPTKDSPKADMKAMAKADSGCSLAKCKSQLRGFVNPVKKAMHWAEIRAGTGRIAAEAYT